jgi:hypothetical protein
MPPRRKSSRLTKAKLEASAKILGIDLSAISIPTPEQSAEAGLRRQLEAESVLYYVQGKGAGFKDKICKECELPFSSTYVAVQYCSELCRANALERLGIDWNPVGRTDSERWGNKIPKIVGPAALEAAKKVIEDD